MKILDQLERCTLRTKLLMGSVVLGCVALTLGLGDLLTQQLLARQIQQLYDKELLGLSHAKNVQINYAGMDGELRQAVIAETPEERDLAVRNIVDLDTRLRQALQELRSRVSRDENQQRVTQFEAAYALYKKNVDRALILLAQDQPAQARDLLASREFQVAGNAARTRMGLIVDAKESDAWLAKEMALEEVDLARVRTFILLIVGTLLGGLTVWLVGGAIRRPASRVRDAVEQLAQGKLSVEVPHQDFNNELGALVRSVQVLQRVAQQTENQDWLKRHLTQISKALQTATTHADLSRTLFSHLAADARIGHGVLYAYEEETRLLYMRGSYALRESRTPESHFELGQGLVGQCALERKATTLTRLPPNYICIGSGLGVAPPRAVALFPLLHGERLLGVLELAMFEQFNEKERALLDGLIPVLAMSLDILEHRDTTQRLLDETRAQAAVLERQAVELVTQKDAVQATETWYQGVIASSPDGMLVLDAEGRIILSNPRLEAMFGYEAGALMGEPIEILMPLPARAAHVGLRTAFAQEGGARRMAAGNKHLHGLRKNGTEFPVEVRLAHLPDAGGRGDCVCASVRDVSDRQQLERSLARSAERLGFALRGGMLGLWDWDVSTGRNEVNEIWAEMLGYTLDEVNEDGHAAATWRRLMHPEDSADVHRRFLRCIEDSREPEFQALFRMKAKAGDWRWILSMGRATERDIQGRALRFVGIHQDYTERKQLQDEMARARDIAETAGLVDQLLTQVTPEPPAGALRTVSDAPAEYDFEPALEAFQQAGGAAA